MDTREQSPLGDLALPPPPERGGHPAQWARAPPVPITVQAPPPPRQYSRTPSPVETNTGCHLMMEDEQSYTEQPQTTPPMSRPTYRPAPTPPAYPTRNWSCLHLDQPDCVDSSADPPISSSLHLPPHSSSNAPRPRVSGPVRTSSPPPGQDYRAALPVERWAENVNRYYGAHNATRGEGGVVPDEELSELDSLYQASLRAPSMHRGSHGISPQTTSNKPGNCRHKKTGLAQVSKSPRNES